ncbi:unnamed protein product [Peniophora sp. CBMAI 1063]|nr:unnamed protein product [Peniophora sp. CBMAI 1063]
MSPPVASSGASKRPHSPESQDSVREQIKRFLKEAAAKPPPIQARGTAYVWSMPPIPKKTKITHDADTVAFNATLSNASIAPLARTTTPLSAGMAVDKDSKGVAAHETLSTTNADGDESATAYPRRKRTTSTSNENAHPIPCEGPSTLSRTGRSPRKSLTSSAPLANHPSPGSKPVRQAQPSATPTHSILPLPETSVTSPAPTRPLIDPASPLHATAATQKKYHVKAESKSAPASAKPDASTPLIVQRRNPKDGLHTDMLPEAKLRATKPLPKQPGEGRSSVKTMASDAPNTIRATSSGPSRDVRSKQLGNGLVSSAEPTSTSSSLASRRRKPATTERPVMTNSLSAVAKSASSSRVNAANLSVKVSTGSSRLAGSVDTPSASHAAPVNGLSRTRSDIATTAADGRHSTGLLAKGSISSSSSVRLPFSISRQTDLLRHRMALPYPGSICTPNLEGWAEFGPSLQGKEGTMPPVDDCKAFLAHGKRLARYTGYNEHKELIAAAKTALTGKDVHSFHSARRRLMMLGFQLASLSQSPELCDSKHRLRETMNIVLEVASESCLPRPMENAIAYYGAATDNVTCPLNRSDVVCAFGSGAVHAAMFLGALIGCNSTAYTLGKEYEPGAPGIRARHMALPVLPPRR